MSYFGCRAASASDLQITVFFPQNHNTTEALLGIRTCSSPFDKRVVLNPRMKEQERSLDPQLWHACSGGMVEMPLSTPKSSTSLRATKSTPPPPSTSQTRRGSLPSSSAAWRPSSSSLTRRPDEVYAKIGLVPLQGNELDLEDDGAAGGHGSDHNPEKPASFAKTLTQSDATTAGGFPSLGTALRRFSPSWITPLIRRCRP
ncbi:hypothetical protein MLD38_004026 [Melastoma candidum]|uniref:Uncharacterized protein n=1 Tax=Melastoma candidum TaxID=119954 RepID=A0ACB9S910_9MYRT|nr:hypothetical protein MLD38_004026 [Melastoma candidum]